MEITKFAGKQPEPYREHGIILTDRFAFAVVFDDEPHPAFCQSLIEAHAKIDEHLKRKSKQAKAKETCKLPYASIDIGGELRTGIVRGFHAAQGHVLAKPELDASSWYPDTPQIREQLMRLGKLQAEAREIEYKLRPFRLSAKPVYGRTDSSRYDEVLAGIVKDYEVKKAKAHAASLKIVA
jgi:hypothetical protein